MRPSIIFISFLLLLCLLNVGLFSSLYARSERDRGNLKPMQKVVSALGFSDVVIATEARYIRHYSISDNVAPFMDHPGALEHFPSGSVWRPSR